MPNSCSFLRLAEPLHWLISALRLVRPALVNLNNLNVIIVNLQREHKVQNHRNHSRDCKTSLHDQHNSVKEALQSPIWSGICEDVRKPRRDQSGAVADGEGSGEDEAVSSVEFDAAVDDGQTGDGDGAEEESRHAAEDGAGDGHQTGGEFGKDAGQNEEETGLLSALNERRMDW
jgi:hypothetical protein